MNLLASKRIYLIGIKGAGMAALAELLLRSGVRVSGSDTEEVFYTDAVLAKLGIEVLQPFAASQVAMDADAYIYSTAYTRDNNPELAFALGTGKPVISYPEALGLLSQSKLTLAVCGTHGKTTTSALLAHALAGAGLQPSAIVGSAIPAWGGGALAGNGQYLVIEADEYQDKLRHYHPFGIILTSVDWDHPDFFPSVRDYESVFTRFVARLPRHGVLVACGDQARVRVVAEASPAPVVYYGTHEDNAVRITGVEVIPPASEAGRRGLRQSFSIEYLGEQRGPFELQLAGRHNAENAAAVIALFLHLKLPLDTLATSLASFSGTKRRFEALGEYRGALIYDDYAHHPDEIRTTVRAFRELFPERRLTIVFHPHTFTRTKALFEDFAEALSDADRIHMLDIYGSARETQGGVSSQELVERINRVYPGKAVYAPLREALLEELATSANKEDLIVTMGAGDVWQIAEQLVRKKP